MGSDSRTATATSSKTRPSWRNRHLSQLSDEQLDEVKQYRDASGTDSEDVALDRAAESAEPETSASEDEWDIDLDAPAREDSEPSVAAVVGVESAAELQRGRSAELPRRQAGPESGDRRDRVDDRAPKYRQRSEPPYPADDSSQRSTSRRPDRAARQQDNRAAREPERQAVRARQHEERARRPERDDRMRPAAERRPAERRDDKRRNEEQTARTQDHEHRQQRRRPAEVRQERDVVSRRSPSDRPTDRPIERNRNPAYRDDRSSNQQRDGRQHRAPQAEADRAARQATAATHVPQPVSDSEKSGETAAREGIVARVLDFKLQGPVKYAVMALAIAALIAVSLMKPIDNSSQSQLDSALTRAMIGFGLARTLNGVISVAQGTEFAVQPAGVGVNFSPGEILDPINDLVERFSWVMLLATSSLGVQKILLEVSSWAGISVLLAGAGLFFLLTRLRNSSVARLADVAGKILLVMILVRFLIPVGALANDWVYKQFLQPKYEQSSEQLEIASNRIREISTRQTQPEKTDGSLKDRAKNLYNSMTSKFDFEGMLDDYKNSAENVSEHAISLIVVFTLQTVVFPLLFLYLIYRLFRAVLLPSRHSRA